MSGEPTTAAPTGVRSDAVVRGNDWGALHPAPLDGWTPIRSTTVVIPTYGAQATLDLTLASLAAQTHPASMLEVVVVDDGSTPPVVLPEIRPEHTRLVLAPVTGWGRAHACHAGAMVAEGEVLHWLDADMVVFAEHVAAQARWHDLSDHLVTIGYKRFVDPEPRTPFEVFEAVAAGRASELYDLEGSTPHEWIEKIIDDTDGLRTAGSEAFRVHVGATATVRRDLYLACGGMDTSLKLGEDSELGYRLAQAGAVFVPEPAARSWHLGPSTVMRTVDTVSRYNRPFITDRMPVPRFRRRSEAGRLWSVPFVDVHVETRGAGYEQVKATVDSVLRSTVPDLTVTVLGDWSLGDARRSPLGDPDLDRRLVVATYAGDPRVHLVAEPAPTSHPATFRLHVPVGWQLGRGTLDHLVRDAEQRRLALSSAALPGVDPHAAVLRLERTSSVSRALRLLAARGVDAPGPEDLDDLLDLVGGQRWYDAADIGVQQHAAGEADPAPTAPAVPTTAAEWKKEAAAARADARRWKDDAKRWKDQAKAEAQRAKQLGEQQPRRRSLARRGVGALARRVRRLASVPASPGPAA